MAGEVLLTREELRAHLRALEHPEPIGPAGFRLPVRGMVIDRCLDLLDLFQVVYGIDPDVTPEAATQAAHQFAARARDLGFTMRQVEQVWIAFTAGRWLATQEMLLQIAAAEQEAAAEAAAAAVGAAPEREGPALLVVQAGKVREHRARAGRRKPKAEGKGSDA